MLASRDKTAVLQYQAFFGLLAVCSTIVIKLNASDKIIVLKLINEEFAHYCSGAGLRNYAGVSKVCITYFYSDIVVVKFLKIYLEPDEEF